MKDKSINALGGLDELIGGAITQRFSHSMEDVIANILDLNTPAVKPRTITIKVTIKPDESREGAEFAVDVIPKLQPRRAVKTELRFGTDDNGVICAREITRQIPGQTDFEGNEIVSLVKPLAAIK